MGSPTSISASEVTLIVAVGVTGLHGRDLDRYRDERLVPIAELAVSRCGCETKPGTVKALAG